MNFKAKKFLGQNFLKDKKVLKKIVAAAELKKEDIVLEVGAGLGILTEKLAEKAKIVFAVEKDKRFINFLREKFKTQKNVKIIEGDILKILDFSKNQDSVLLRISQFLISNLKFQNYKVVANIPYYITSRFLKLLLESKNKPQLIVLLIQKEVAERICAKKGENNLLSLSCQYYGDPKILDFVPKIAFYPQPKVDSAILKIKVFKELPYKVSNEALFFKILRAAFQGRRKQLHNSLSKNLKIPQKTIKKIIQNCQINFKLRPQDLGLNDFKKLYSIIHKRILRK